MKEIKIEKYECKRCFYEWIPRLERKPLVCPACKSRLWDKARVKFSNKTADMLQR